MGIATPVDPISEGTRVFMLASTTFALEKGDVPLKVRNFAKEQNDG